MAEQAKTQKTIMKKKGELDTSWLVLNAEGKTLGRFASEVAQILRGKHKPSFTPHIDVGDGVIVINAEKIKVTGSKEAQKVYRYYTGNIGGLREIPYEVMKARKPEYIIKNAVWGMMPKTKLSKAQMKKLRIFKGKEHSLTSQQPIEVNI